jgi:hypothetical protein
MNKITFVLTLMTLVLVMSCVTPKNSVTTANPAVVICIFAVCEQEDAEQSGANNKVGQEESAKTDLKLKPGVL